MAQTQRMDTAATEPTMADYPEIAGPKAGAIDVANIVSRLKGPIV